MKKILLIIIFLFTSCLNNEKEKKDINFGIVIHGGAGTLLKENMSDEKEKQYLNALETAIKIGHNIIKDGGSSQLAVERTINFLENSPLFNAGKGAVLTSSGTVELDASFMDGKTLNAGAIAGVRTLKNPISAAIKVMENSPHVFLSGEGADQFGKEQGLDIVNQKYFLTKRRIKSLKNVKEKELNNDKISLINSKEYMSQKYGTVGCVVLDKNGNLASGTSTGGMTNKKWNRIGDVPVIGAGTYANNRTCAVSSTGWGEFFIRNVVAYDISALIEYKGLSLKEAARIVIHDKVAKLGGNGGVIAIDNKGNIAMEMNTPGMYRAHINSQGELTVKIFN